MNKKYCSFIAFVMALVILLSSASSYAVDKKAVGQKKLTASEVDAAFDQVFSIQKKIKRMKAKVITEKSGGIFKNAKASEAFVFAQMPDKLLFIDKGIDGKSVPENKYAIILIDGTFLWDVKPIDSDGVREAEQIDMKSAGNKDINIAALLIGADVASGKELRDYYDIEGSLEKFDDGTKSYHFVLKTAEGREVRNRKEIVDMWIEVGGVIPWKIKSVRMSPKINPLNPDAPAKMKKTSSVKYITDIETNLSKNPLAEFPKSQFYFGTILKNNPGIKVVDSKGFDIDNEELKKDLEAAKKRL